MDHQEHEAGIQLANRLNEGGFEPVVEEGAATLRVTFGFDDKGHYLGDRPATDQELADLGFERGFVEAHPEGRKRGGYVPYVVCGGATTFWSETDAEWYTAD